MQTLFLVNTITCLLLALMWRYGDFLNFMVKALLAGLTLANGFFFLQLLGYIVKV